MNDSTIAIRRSSEDNTTKDHSAPIHLTSSFQFDNSEEMRALFAGEEAGNVYSRYSNPSVDEFLNKLVSLENGEAGWAMASGMAAIFSTFAALLEEGDHVVSSNALFGSTHKLLTTIFPKWGIKSDLLLPTEMNQLDAFIKTNTKIVFIETPSNPGLQLIDLKRVAKVCHEKGVLFVVDNCFATPILQKPLNFGADVIIHSATKYIDGQGRTLGGAIISAQEIIDKVEAFARHSGPAMSPFNAWVLAKSIETLDVRLERHCNNALELARWLEQQDEVEWVKYPFLPSHPQYDLAQRQMKKGGGVICFELKGGKPLGLQFMDRLSLFSITANLGDTRSIVTHPASSTHSKLSPEEREGMGISEGLIRISVGLESVKDLTDDIRQALRK
ncbi:MAG: trans-sulfuration enzyme family protein [Bacteroidota bacterium]